ncbi:sodium:proton antiporter NhaD [Uliginosibacterium gangwonense]|uniref:sodium:proton antiporter NhaD n=1 Tax=Uliginosibacterium gangwonense TaxID=392736 RepID=UPI00037A64E6|nr:sodium:proton antiporter NhaD [Uliginosibacterium gangwonense]
MLIGLVVVFVMAYVAIALEHPLRVDKSASALIGAGVLWTIYAVFAGDPQRVAEQLNGSLVGAAQIVFFLMGAMTIVELIDAHDGFGVVTTRIRTSTLARLMWWVGGISFVLSAILDNLTTAIVMVSLMRKLLARQGDRLVFAGVIVIAANAGGAWSPMGDVTTTMLWIGGQISALAVVQAVLLPALVCMLVPVSILAWGMRGRKLNWAVSSEGEVGPQVDAWERNLIFILGVGVLLAVPAFKMLTHLPPFMGILFGLGLLWLAGDLLHRNKDVVSRQPLSLTHALARIDMSSLVFFTGILLSVATLEHTHVLSDLAAWLDHAVGRQDVIVMLIGLVSAVVDNVPLVAAAMGMYSLAQYPTDHFLWEFLAYCAGTGGSILIIGSAAGVAAMGIEKINFLWYVKKIGWVALLGYLAGAAAHLVQYRLLH